MGLRPAHLTRPRPAQRSPARPKPWHERSLVAQPWRPRACVHALPDLFKQLLEGSGPRQPKDPKTFRSMDELREQLHHSQPRNIGISGLLNWLSAASFGDDSNVKNWWSPAAIYRALTRGDVRRRRLSEVPLPDIDDTTYSQLSPVLLLSKIRLRKVASNYPEVVDMPTSELALRLVRLSAVLPGCDVAHLVQERPRDFLSGLPEEVEDTVSQAWQLLHQRLAGADVRAMVHHDPGLLFIDLNAGLTRLRELWDEDQVDEQALQNSEAIELACAVRALSDEPPAYY